MKSPHYAWIVALVTFAVLLITAGVRATPGLFFVPLESEFGWSRAVISGAVAINIALFGLIGPFAASVMDRWGLKRVVLCAIALLAASVAMSTQMRTEWQLVLCWGVLVGAGTGVTSMVLAAVVATRWFDERRGVVLGALSAANATGQLVFLPFLASVIEASGWRTAAFAVAGAALIVFVLVLLFMRDRPKTWGCAPTASGMTRVQPRRHGRWLPSPRSHTRPGRRPSGCWPARSSFAARARTVSSARTSSRHVMTTESRRSDRRSCSRSWESSISSAPRRRDGSPIVISRVICSLAITRCAACRCSILPATLDGGATNLGWFAVFYGLDWVATVPPTVRLTSEAFGRENTGVVYGWIGASHQLGASLAAFGAGAIRTELGDYRLAFWIAGTLCLVAGLSFLAIGRSTARAVYPGP